ncbi:prolyl oligopeptidase family serine peptidase [Bradyrhizobium sp. 33ap4]|uniref:prolyl oligopeptidase family serine peptidase n=1 Tax=Bradyrhizobium sp. 33ap4 TaxID=3061630 RepID=UPI0039776FF6
MAKDTAPYEPVKNVTREYPPTLMIHGTQDTDRPVEESLKMAEQFKRYGVPYILASIDKGEHCFTGGDRAQIEVPTAQCGIHTQVA